MLGAWTPLLFYILYLLRLPVECIPAYRSCPISQRREQFKTQSRETFY